MPVSPEARKWGGDGGRSFLGLQTSNAWPRKARETNHVAGLPITQLLYPRRHPSCQHVRTTSSSGHNADVHEGTDFQIRLHEH